MSRSVERSRYANGDGVPDDIANTALYLRMAAPRRHPQAMDALNRLRKQLKSGQVFSALPPVFRTTLADCRYGCVRNAVRPETRSRRAKENCGIWFGGDAIDSFLDDSARSTSICVREWIPQSRQRLNLGLSRTRGWRRASIGKAIGDGPAAATAAIFWMRTRANWTETLVHHHAMISPEPLTPDEWDKAHAQQSLIGENDYDPDDKE